MTQRRRLALAAGGACGSALLVGAVLLSPSNALLALVGLLALTVAFRLIRRRPDIGAAVVIVGLALQPILKFEVSPLFGPAKDGLVILLAAVFATRARQWWATLAGRDAVIGVFVGALVVLYLINPAGAHDAAWSDETRLVIESFLLFCIALAEPQAHRVARVAIAALVILGAGEALYGILQQLVGYAYLVTHLGYAFGNQVRLTSSGNLRSFGTFDDAFSYGAFETLALVCSFWFRPRRGVLRWGLPGLLALGVIVSFVRTDWLILAVLALVAGCRLIRPSASAGFLLATALTAVAVGGVLSTVHVAAPGSAGKQSFIFSVNGRTQVWSKLVPNPSVLLAGDGAGKFGSGLARAEAGSGIVANERYVPGQAPQAAAQGAVTSIDNAYLATFGDVGIPGMLLLIGILARLFSIFRRSSRSGSPFGWMGLGVLGVMAIDGLTRSSLTAFPSGYIYLYLVGVLAAAAMTPEHLLREPSARWDTSGIDAVGPYPLGPAGQEVVARIRRSPADVVSRLPLPGRRPSSAAEREDRGFSARRGASSALVSRLVGKAVALPLILILARRGGPAELAQYTYLLLTASTVTSITDLGLAAVAGRDVARGDRGAASAYRSALPGQLASNLVAGCIIIGFGTLAPGPGVTITDLGLTALFSLANGTFDLQCELLRGMGKPLTEANLQVLSAILQMALGAAAIFTTGSLAVVMAALALSATCSVAAAQHFLPLPRSLDRRPGASNWVLVRSALWLGAGGTFLAFALRLAPLVLANVASIKEIADFSIASRYLDLETTLLYAVGVGLLPSLARHASDSAASFRAHVRLLITKSTVALALVAVPLSFAVPWATVLLFGGRYRSAGTAALLLVAAAPIFFVLYLSWFVLLAEKREKAVLQGTLVGLVVAALTAGVLVVPLRSSSGAALATIAAGTVCAALLFLAANRPARLRRPEPELAVVDQLGR